MLGCSGPCDEVGITNTSSAQLTVTESAAETAEYKEAGVPAYLGIQDDVVTSVETTFQGDQAMNPDPDPDHCINVGTPIEIFLACPAGPGQFDLGSLHATACDPGTHCAALSGTLTVRAIAQPCHQGACGRLDADLNVTGSVGGAGLSVSGKASLSYVEAKFTSFCGGSDG
jgi:hypothetical protein